MSQDNKPLEFWIKSRPIFPHILLTNDGRSLANAYSVDNIPLVRVIPYQEYESAQEENAKLREQVKVMREALEYYAYIHNWDSYLGVKGQIDDDDIDLVEYFVDGVDCSDDCGGKRAREALKEIEK